MEDANLLSTERQFQDLAPLNEKHFCPFFEFFFDTLRSVAVDRIENLCEINTPTREIAFSVVNSRNLFVAVAKIGDLVIEDQLNEVAMIIGNRESTQCNHSKLYAYILT